jgi:hypothetical protein
VASLNLHSAPVTDALVDAPLEAAVDGEAPTARHRSPRSPWWRRASAAPSRGMAYSLGVATVCAMVVIDLAAGDPAATASTQEQSSSIAVADALGIDGNGVDPAATEDPALLGQLAASRSARDEERTAAATVQAKAEQAATAARAAAAAKAAAEAAAAAAAKAAAQEAARVAQAAVPEQAAVAAAAAPAAVAAAAGTAASVIANISNSAGGVRPQAQAAANKVVSNVPGAAGLTIGGTRASATDPNGHPSGLALDYMVGSDSGLGDAIVAYHIAHWDELGVEYIIWQQRMLSSPGGSWSTMDDRGSSTANHMDHPHVNYR